MTTKELVEQEAKKLDKIDPKWYKRIDLERLDMRCIYKCIGGQLTEPIPGIGVSSFIVKYNLNGCAFLFSEKDDELPTDYDKYNVHPDGHILMTSLWKTEIIKRKQEEKTWTLTNVLPAGLLTRTKPQKTTKSASTVETQKV